MRLLFPILFGLSGCFGDSDEKRALSPVSKDKEKAVFSLYQRARDGLFVDKSKLIKAANFARKQEVKADGETIRMLSQLIALERLQGGALERGLDYAEKIGNIQLKNGGKEPFPEEVEIELSLLALANKNIPLAKFFLSKADSSKSKRIKAAAFNTYGLIHLENNKVPEAAAAFKEAMRIDSSYQAASMNLAILSMKFGRFDLGKSLLKANQAKSWLFSAYLINAERLTYNGENAEKMCLDMIGTREDVHPLTLVNCGINAWQAKGDIPLARKRLTAARTSSKAKEYWQETVKNILIKIP